MEANKNKKTQGGRKLKKDTAIHRYCIRLNNEENIRFTTLFLQSGIKEKTGFIKRLF
jgi:hypothetical protein